MAAPQCMSEDGRQAVFVGTFLQTGDSVALCDKCMVPWAAAVLNTMTGIDPAPFIKAISEDVPGAAEGAPTDEPPPPAPHDDDRPPDPPTRKTGRGRSTSGDPPTGTENPAAEKAPGTDEDTLAAA